VWQNGGDDAGTVVAKGNRRSQGVWKLERKGRERIEGVKGRSTTIDLISRGSWYASIEAGSPATSSFLPFTNQVLSRFYKSVFRGG